MKKQRWSNSPLLQPLYKLNRQMCLNWKVRAFALFWLIPPMTRGSCQELNQGCLGEIQCVNYQVMTALQVYILECLYGAF